jgi:hypothetical protein
VVGTVEPLGGVGDGEGGHSGQGSQVGSRWLRRWASVAIHVARWWLAVGYVVTSQPVRVPLSTTASLPMVPSGEYLRAKRPDDIFPSGATERRRKTEAVVLSMWP